MLKHIITTFDLEHFAFISRPQSGTLVRCVFTTPETIHSWEFHVVMAEGSLLPPLLIPFRSLMAFTMIFLSPYLFDAGCCGEWGSPGPRSQVPLHPLRGATCVHFYVHSLCWVVRVCDLCCGYWCFGFFSIVEMLRWFYFISAIGCFIRKLGYGNSIRMNLENCYIFSLWKKKSYSTEFIMCNK